MSERTHRAEHDVALLKGIFGYWRDSAVIFTGRVFP
jgi:hypothetical protein